jgi:hypothetical protein
MTADQMHPPELRGEVLVRDRMALLSPDVPDHRVLSHSSVCLYFCLSWILQHHKSMERWNRFSYFCCLFCENENGDVIKWVKV